MNYIYSFVNKINGKRYIGSTVNNPQKRYNQHIYHVNHTTNKSNYPLYSAMRKYGIQNFNFEILLAKECSEQEIREIEQEYIQKYDCISPKGYNQTLDTQHPLNTKEVYAKMSKTKRNKAKRLAEIDKDHNILNIWRSIIDCAEETGLGEKHISACCRGERHTTQGRYFCWIDENDNLIIPNFVGTNYKGAPGTTQKQSTNKRVCKIDMKTLQILNTYDSAALAARENNCDSSGIIKVCKGRRKSCGGFIWSYAKD